jgi:hypothetical protein
MFKLIATAAFVSLLAACSGMPTGPMTSTMGASGSTRPMGNGSGPIGINDGGPN